MAINANTKIYDKTLDRAAMIRLFERRVNGKVALIIDGHVVRMDKLIKDANLSQKGFETFREAVDKELQGTFREAFNTSRKDLVGMAADQISFTYQNLEAAMGKIWQVKKPRIIPETLVLERPLYNDRTLAQGWVGISLNEKKRLESIIRKGVAEGSTNDEIALEVRRGNIHNITRQQSQTLVTTSITSIRSQADLEIYKTNENALQG
jgi:hypothetical protein